MMVLCSVSFVFFLHLYARARTPLPNCMLERGSELGCNWLKRASDCNTCWRVVTFPLPSAFRCCSSCALLCLQSIPSLTTSRREKKSKRVDRELKKDKRKPNSTPTLTKTHIWWCMLKAVNTVGVCRLL